MVETVLLAAAGMGDDLLLVGAAGIAISATVLALVVGWKFITKMIL